MTPVQCNYFPLRFNWKYSLNSSIFGGLDWTSAYPSAKYSLRILTLLYILGYLFYSASRFSKAHICETTILHLSLSHLRIIRVNPSRLIRVNPSHYYIYTTEGSILTLLRSKSAIVSFFQTLIK